MNSDLPGLIGRFAGIRVLVIGETMLDCYVLGSAGRICQEAPVPVVAVAGQTEAPGGAANTAANLAALGASTMLVSLVGDDQSGARVRAVLAERGVDTTGVVVESHRRTLAKQRIVADGQLLVRLDSGDTRAPAPHTERALIDQLTALISHCDAVVISDYDYGVLTPRVREALHGLLTGVGVPLLVDAKDLTRYRDRHPTVAKPNYGQACALLGEAPAEGTRARAGAVAAAASRLLDLTGAQLVAVTLDTDGALLLEPDAPPYRTYARPVPRMQTSGAGDTYLAALTLAMTAGATTPAAAEIASAAASLVAGREGTACCTAEELEDALHGDVKLFSNVERLLVRLARERAGRRIVFTNGCFDLLHRGHITYLNRAKALGDILVIGLNADAGVRRLKGPERPLNPLDDRAQVLAALSCVDYIVPFEEDTPARLIEAIRPEIYVKGGDYRLETLPERKQVEALGGSVQILAYVEERSTTGLIERIRGQARGGRPAGSRAR